MSVNTKTVRLALCQLRTETVLEETLDKTARMVREAAQSGAQIVVLPEMFSCPYSGRYFRSFAAKGHEPILEKLSAWAGENSVLLVGGSIPETEDGKLYNSAFVFGPDGRQLARHRKVHLFDVDIPGMRFKESNTFAAGDGITVFDSPFGRFGLAVCFDLRFPELFRAMAERGAQAVFLPAQFNLKTGPMAWELLLRARAADNQFFVAACAAARYEGFDYECWGHSTVTDPFGRVAATCDETEQILHTELDLSLVDEARRQIPTLSALREELYPVAKGRRSSNRSRPIAPAASRRSATRRGSWIL